MHGCFFHQNWTDGDIVILKAPVNFKAWAYPAYILSSEIKTIFSPWTAFHKSRIVVSFALFLLTAWAWRATLPQLIISRQLRLRLPGSLAGCLALWPGTIFSPKKKAKILARFVCGWFPWLKKPGRRSFRLPCLLYKKNKANACFALPVVVDCHYSAELLLFLFLKLLGGFSRPSHGFSKLIPKPNILKLYGTEDPTRAHANNCSESLKQKKLPGRTFHNCKD